jgi:ABC-type Zn uptake system ZnuABC Zn-binding protein ZnuA
LLALQFTACEKPPVLGPEDYLPNKKFKVVTTTIQLAELARELGGDMVTVECLLEPKASLKKTDGAPSEPIPWNPNPFGWKARASDIFAMQTAHLVVLNGLGMEASMERKIPELRKSGVIVVVVGDTIPEAEILTNKHLSNAIDPCYWNSPKMWKYAIKSVTAGMQQLVPKEAADYFEHRSHPISDRMDRILSWGEEKFSNFTPKGKRFILTSHDTMQYFARDFGIEALAIWTPAGEQIQMPETELRGWIEKIGVKDFIPDAAAPTDAMEEVAVKLGLFRAIPIYSIMPDRPGTKQLGLLESFDVSTYDGVMRHMIRGLERRLGGAKPSILAAPVPKSTEPETPAEEPSK